MKKYSTYLCRLDGASSFYDDNKIDLSIIIEVEKLSDNDLKNCVLEMVSYGVKWIFCIGCAFGDLEERVDAILESVDLIDVATTSHEDEDNQDFCENLREFISVKSSDIIVYFSRGGKHRFESILSIIKLNIIK